MKKTHELWVDEDGLDTFCLAGKEGEQARSLLTKNARMVWQVEAESHFEAMTNYYKYRGYGEYKTEFDQDLIPYNE